MQNTQEKVLLEATLCFLKREGQVYLALKQHKIGMGCWNGYGGGPEEGDVSIEDTAVREVMEETRGVRIRPESLEKVAIIDFHNTKSDGKIFSCRVHTFLCREWEGDPQDTDEMRDGRWFDDNNLPLNEMMPADRCWLPLVLSGKKIVGKASYGTFQLTLLGPVSIEEVEAF